MPTRHAATGPRRLRRTADGSTFAPTRFELEPLGITLGAEVQGLDLGQPVDDATFAELQRCWLEWKVLVFRDQHLSIEQHGAFAARWGRLIDDQLDTRSAENPADNVVVFTRDATTVGLENCWHTDGTFRPMPTAGTTLRAIEVPDVGGDTLFADSAAAYDNLADDDRALVDRLDARHDWSIGEYAGKYGDQLDHFRSLHPPAVHPMAIAHPVTGRPTLFVNALFTDAVVGVDAGEGERLLDRALATFRWPELQFRLRWRPGTLALWDNIAVQHYGASDYYPARRTMARATFMSTTFDHLERAPTTPF